MNKYFYITRKYFRSHPKQCISMALCISMFMFSILTVLLYNQSYRTTLIENYRMKNGSYQLASFYADENIVYHNENVLIDEGAGIIRGLWEIEDSSNNYWIGDVNENILELLPITLISGRMPVTENEIVIEKSTYDTLKIGKNVGETVEFEIKNSNDITERKSFILTGILDDFTRNIKLLSNETQAFEMPSLLTVFNEQNNPSYIHVFAKEPSLTSRNLNSKYTYFATADQYILLQKSTVSKIILYPMAVFFAITTVMGIFVVSSYFFKEQEHYLNTLRCIGFSEKKVKKLLFIQGILMFLASFITSCFMSLIALFLIKFISSFSSQKLLLDLSWKAFFITGFLGAVIILISFNSLRVRFYKIDKLEQSVYSPKKHRKSQENIKRCWHKAYGIKYRLQNTTCFMLISFCVAMSLFGSFLPLFYARGNTFTNPDDYPDDTDYSLHMLGGSSSEESYYINFPVGCGASRDMANIIIDDKRLQITEASVEHLCIPFFLSSADPSNRFLHHYVVEARKHDYNFLFENSHKEEMITIAGGDNENDCLVEVPTKWQSFQSILNTFKDFTNGGVNEKNFTNGIEIIAPDNYCQVGDEFTMVIPIPDAGANEKNIEEHIKFHTCNVKVAATYSPDIYDTSSLILSLEYIFSIYPDLNYETILVKNLEPENMEWTEQLQHNLQLIESDSKGIKYDNYLEMSKEFYDKVNLETLQVITSIFLFIVIIWITIVYSTYAQVRSDFMSYKIMRAIGIKIEKIKKLILNEVNCLLIRGIIVGSICGWVTCIYFAIINAYVKSWDIFIIYVLPVFLVTLSLLYFGTRFSVKKSISNLISDNIIEQMNEIE